MTTVVIDCETRSETDLRAVGPWVYSEHPSTEVICLTWTVDGTRIGCWLPPAFGGTDECPPELVRYIREGAAFEAHNTAFEYSIWLNVLMERHGWPGMPIDRWRDLMAVACYYSMPPKLEKLLNVLGLPGKDPDGERLISRYSKLHLKTAKREIPPDDLLKFCQYCAVDTQREWQAGQLLGELPPAELENFKHDFAVNARGIYLDLSGLEDARAVVRSESERIVREFKAITGLEPTKRDKVLAWARERGVSLPDYSADTLRDFLKHGALRPRDGYEGDELEEIDHQRQPLPDDVKRALQLRLSFANASTQKLDAMVRQRGRDGRARFQTRYHGAGTGRNTATGFQVLNMSRGYDRKYKSYDWAGQLARDIAHRDAAFLRAIYGDAMEAVGKATRHWIKAEKGNRILAGDYSSIEAVILAVLAGEQWKVDLFHQPDPRVYETTAEMIHQLPPGTVSKATHPMERQDGKTLELACGYQGALNAYLKFDSSGRNSDETIIKYVRAWRGKHPRTCAYWTANEDAAIEAVLHPGRVTGYEDQELFERVDGWLTMILPNGKRLWYWAPEVRMTWPQWHRPLEFEDCAHGECRCEKRPQVFYKAQKMGRWMTVSSYGGKWVENRVQATSRELLKPAERRVQAAKYPVILSVYDEIVAEAPIGHGSLAEFEELVAEVEDWATGWPVRVDAWEGDRYRK